MAISFSDDDKRFLGILALALVIGIGVDEGLHYVGVQPTGASYVAGPQGSQATATVAIHNYTDSTSQFTVQGYQVRSDVLASIAAPPLGIGMLESALTRFNKIAAARSWSGTPGVTYPNGLFAGHWFSMPNVIASGAGATDPSTAQAERNIPVTVSRGKVTTIQAYTGTPFTTPAASVASAIRNFWLVLPANGTGSPLSVYLDPKPVMPAVS